jgi:hypothetical protein
VKDKIKEYYDRRTEILNTKEVEISKAIKNEVDNFIAKLIKREQDRIMIETYGEHEGSGEYLNDD